MATVRHLGLFPFCVAKYPPNNGITTFEVGDFTQYPLTIPLKHACLLWWRVKEWELSFVYSRFRQYADGSYDEINNTPVILNTKDSTFRTIKADVKNEKELVCFGSYEESSVLYQWTWQATETYYNPGPPPVSGTRTISLTAEFGTNWDTQSLGFCPAFSLKQDPRQTWLWAAFYVAAAEFGTLKTEMPIATGNITLDKVDYEFKLGSSGPGAPVGSVSLSDVKIAPSQWYEYNPNDGLGPIYDKQTGSQLRPFPS